jgi:hypothetical protein
MKIALKSPTPEGVHRFQWVIDELAVVVDARDARHADELVTEDLAPEPLDRLDLREEAVAADVEPKSPVKWGVREIPPTMSVPSSTVTE